MTSDGSTLTVERARRVDEEATVRHVDQLSTETRRALRAMVDGERRDVAGLTTGEVIVGVEYYRVVSAETRIGERDSEPARA